MPEAGGCGGTLLDQRSVLLCDLIHVGNSASDLSNRIALLSCRGADLRNQVGYPLCLLNDAIDYTPSLIYLL